MDRIKAVARAYHTAGILLVIAVVLLYLPWPTDDAKSAAAVAAAGFIGAAITRAADIAQERRRQAERELERRLSDLDETRRLSYDILLSQRLQLPAPVSSHLLATVANALAHHGSGVDYSEASTHLIQIVIPNQRRDESRAWLEAKVEELTAEINSLTKT